MPRSARRVALGVGTLFYETKPYILEYIFQSSPLIFSRIFYWNIGIFQVLPAPGTHYASTPIGTASKAQKKYIYIFTFSRIKAAS